jgi:NAD(P)H-hydrate epimerase
MKLFRTSEVHNIDAYTIAHEPIADIDLMERAAGKLFGWVTAHFDKDRRVMVFTGPGNNGGDSLALARMLAGAGYVVEDYFLRFTDKISNSCRINLERLEKRSPGP